MPYLNLDLDYFDHPKTRRLIGILGVESALLPLKLWCYVGKYHCETGALEGYSGQEVESIAGWTGEPGKMITTMLKDGIGLLEEISNGFKIHDWFEHAGHLRSFKKRAKSAAKKRWKSYATSTAKRKITNTPNLPNLPNLPNQDIGVSVSSVVKEWNSIPGVKPCAEQPVGFIADRIKREVKKQPTREWWAQYFTQIRESDFLCGRSTDFQATIDWVLGPKNMAKILAGNYRNKSPTVAVACQERVYRGNFLKPCGEPSVGQIGGRPLCQSHKEHHESRTHAVTT